MPEAIPKRLITRTEAMQYLCISEHKLWELTRDGHIPAIKIGRAVRYDVADLDLFIQRCKS